jgi:two-component system OmpR family response regulator
MEPVYGDRALLFEALSNLLDNSLKFTPFGGEVRVELKSSTPGPLLVVLDNGPGIAATEREAVLHRFYRAEKTRHVPGSGLGLGIVSAVMRMHDFKLDIRGANPGTAMVLEFGLILCNRSYLAMRVLLISAPEREARYFHKALRESAHSVRTSNGFRLGLYLASKEMFDAIVIAAVGPMPVASLLEAIPAFSHLPGSPAIIVVCAHATSQERGQMLRAGADACFVEPYSFIEIHERMLALQRASLSGNDLRSKVATMKIDSVTHELIEGSLRLLLTKREYLLIECLLRQNNSPVAREQLIQYAWPERDDADPAIVNLLVSRLRQKLKVLGFKATIQTVSRYGYQLDGDEIATGS